MSIDTQGHDAEWWAEQCARFRTETDSANEAADRARADLKAAESAHTEALAKLTATYKVEREKLIQDHSNTINQLKDEQNRALKAVLDEHPEARRLREQNAAEAKSLAETQRARMAEFRKKVQGSS